MVSNLAYQNKDKYYFAQEGEAKSFRVFNFDNNSKGFWYIYYKNDNDPYLRERAEISSLQNVIIIPFLKNGYCISEVKDKEEEDEDKPTVLRGTKKSQKAKGWSTR